MSYKVKIVLITVIPIILVLGILGLTQKKVDVQHTYTKEERLMILGMPMVHSTDTSGEMYSISLQEKYMKMSDEEFEQHLKENIKSVIKRKAKGEELKWDKTFVETIIKKYFPEFYTVISDQMKPDSNAH